MSAPEPVQPPAAPSPQPPSRSASRWGERTAEMAGAALSAIGEGTVKMLAAALSVAMEIGRRALISWGVFELARWILPHYAFLGAHLILIAGAIMTLGGLVGFVLCAPWAAIATFVDWANPVERADRTLNRMAEWGRFVLGWLIWMAPWALSAWALSAPWQGHWAELAAQLAHSLKIG